MRELKWPLGATSYSLETLVNGLFPIAFTALTTRSSARINEHVYATQSSQLSVGHLKWKLKWFLSGFSSGFPSGFPSV